MAMLAVVRLGEDAFGDRIREELRTVAGREMAVSTVYVTLVRLEDQGLVESRMVAVEPGVGGRPRRCFYLTDAGREALRSSRDALARMWVGVESI